MSNNQILYKPKAIACTPSTDVSVWSLRTPEGSSIKNLSSVIFVPIMGATYIWNPPSPAFAWDLERGNGFALIDPHGELVERIAARIPASQQQRVFYLNATP